MSAVLIKYWLRYKKKEKDRKTERPTPYFSSVTAQICEKSCTQFFVLQWFMNYSIFTGSIKTPYRHMRAQEGAHMHTCAHTPTLTHTQADTIQAKGETVLSAYVTWADFKAYLLDHFF